MIDSLAVRGLHLRFSEIMEQSRQAEHPVRVCPLNDADRMLAHRVHMMGSILLTLHTAVELRKENGSQAGLPGIPVSSGGNYTDENGQQWICDEIDFKRGKYVQRVAWVTFDGSDDEPWVFDLGGPNNLFPRGRVLMYGMCSQKLRNRVLCNRRIYSTAMTYDTENTCFSNAANIYIYGEKATIETDTEWRQELSEKPVTVLYELETPIETDLTEEQMAAYANLHTNRPTTVVSATDGAGLRLTYKTKKSLEVTD